MRRTATVAAFMMLLVPLGCAPAPNTPAGPNPDQYAVNPSPSAEPLTNFKIVDETLGTQNVEIVLPQGFKAGSSDKYPVVVFFHSYQQNSHQMAKLTRFARFCSDMGWICASGDLGGTEHWGNAKALSMHHDMMQRLREAYQVDPQREYYVGFSMGGGTAVLAAIETKGTDDEPAAVASSQGWFSLAQMREAHAGMYASSIDQAYGGSLSAADQHRGDLIGRANELAGMPVYLEHGDADQYVPPSQSQDMHDALDKLGIANVFHMWPGLGHTESTIHEAAILDFFKDKKRSR